VSEAPAHAEPRPAISVQPANGSTRAIAIVLPGGRADSFELTQNRHLSAVRMRPFARSLHGAGRHAGLTVMLLRYRYRGWNGREMSPVADARWALDDARARHGDVPVVLVGHSMGGRTALRVAGHDSVRGVAALAPWLPDGDRPRHAGPSDQPT
jgi:pimeloyl-ACP methyl ester carboxylesterase